MASCCLPPAQPFPNLLAPSRSSPIATYCSSANCTSGQRVSLPTAQDTPVFLQASDYPDGLFLIITNPNASIEFSTVRYSCPSPVHTPIMFYHHAPSTTSSASTSPYYSLCTVKPNNVVSSGRTAFSWGWSFSTLPPSFNATGFYALLPRFHVALPESAYTLRLTRALWPGLTMAIDVTLFEDNDPWVSVSNGATLDLANYPVTVNGLSFGFHVPAGMQGQSAAVDLFLANSTQVACAGAHAPLLVVPHGTTASVALRVSSFLDRSIPTDAMVPKPDELRGGCAWLFPGVLPAGKPRVCFATCLTMTLAVRYPRLRNSCLCLPLSLRSRRARPSAWCCPPALTHKLCGPPVPFTGIVSQHSLAFSMSRSPYAVALAWTPGADGHPLRPYQSIVLPGYPHSVIALLSGMGEYATFAMEYMAKLDTCASPLTTPVNIRSSSASPSTNDVSISFCAPLPVVSVTPVAAANDTSAGEPVDQAQGCAVDASWKFDLEAEIPALFAMGGTAEVEVPLELNGCPAGLYALNLLSPPTPGSDPEDPTPGVHDGAVQAVFVVAGGGVVGDLGGNGTVTLPENVTALRLVLTLPPLNANTSSNSSSGNSTSGTVQELSISLRLTSVPPSDASAPSASPSPTPYPSPSDASTPSARPTVAPIPAPSPSEDPAPAPTPAPSYGSYGTIPSPTAVYGASVPAPLASPSGGAAGPAPSPAAPLPRPLLVGSPAPNPAPSPSPSADGVDQVGGGVAAPAPAASSTQQGPANSGSSVTTSVVLTALAVLVSMGALLVS